MFLLLISFSVFAQVEDIGLRTRIDGFFGNVGMCQHLSVSELESVDECVNEYALPKISQAVAQLNLENYLEELIFNELARRSHNVVNCQIDFFDSLKPEFSAVIQDRSWVAFQASAPQIKELMQLKAEREAFKTSMKSTLDPMDRSKAQLDQRKKIIEVAEEIKAIDQALASLTSQIPLGQHSQVSQDLINYAVSNISNENGFKQAYWSSVRKLKSQVTQSSRTYKSLQQKDGLYKLSRNEKISFVKSGQAESMIERMDLSPQVKKKIICRLRAQYLKGPTTTGALGTIALVGGGFATGGISSVALRGVASLGISAAASVDIAMTVRDQCLAHTMNISASDNPQCSAEEFVNSSISESNFNTCATAIVLAGSPLLARFGSKIVSRVVNSPPLTPPAQVEIVSARVRKGLFDVKKTSAYSDDAIQVGMEDGGHMYLMAGGKRYDGITFPGPAKVKDTHLASNGVLFRIDVSAERAKKVAASLEQYKGTKNISCVHGVCRILQQNDIVIASEKPGVQLRIREVLQGLTHGNVTVAGKPANVRMYASSQQSLNEFLNKTPQAMKRQTLIVAGLYTTQGSGVVVPAFKAYEIIEEQMP